MSLILGLHGVSSTWCCCLAPHGLSRRVSLQPFSVAIFAFQVIDLDLNRHHRRISPNRFFLTTEETWWVVVLRAYERGIRHDAVYRFGLCLVTGALARPLPSGFLPALTLTVRV